MSVANKKRLSVADFFCGAGGFSEGFRQNGFDIVFALDNWQPSIDTFSFNHPNCKTVKMSITDITPNNIHKTVPNVSIIIGSPPCTEFSKSNRGGNGNTKEGMELVIKFLQIIALKKPKFWILENVPPLEKQMKKSYTYAELGLKGGNKTALEIPNILVLNAADFGVPQKRYRFFCGNFPIPEPMHNSGNYVNLRKVIEAFPPSLSKMSANKIIVDPNFNFSIKAKFLTDHFYDTYLERFEWEEARRLKIDHSYYGKMSFPENLDKPSRTIMATLTRVSRESIIMDNGKHSYRHPTIREVATIQSYPITYQFVAKNENTKYKLVGNSVPPKMISALAEAISKEMKIEPRMQPNPHLEFKQPLFNLNGLKRSRKNKTIKPLSAKFRIHIPRLKIHNYRVDLDNLSSEFDRGKIVWKASIHHGTGRLDAKKAVPTLKQTESLLSSHEDRNRVEKFKKLVAIFFTERIPDANMFQEIYANRIHSNGYIGPKESLHEIRKLIDKFFPLPEHAEKEIKNNGRIDLKKDKIPLPIAAGLYACKYIESLTRSP